jgi:hypothetical protein
MADQLITIEALSYSRSELFRHRNTCVTLTTNVIASLRQHGLLLLQRGRTRRGCRGGAHVQRRPTPMYTAAVPGCHIITGNKPTIATFGQSSPAAVVDVSTSRRPPNVLHVHIDRHSTPPSKTLVMGCLNIRSLANKLDDLMEVRHDLSLDVMFLVETWHDSDSVCLARLRADGYLVMDRSRPRLVTDTLATNHGGMAVVAAPGIRLAAFDLGVKPESFELLVVRITSGSMSHVAVVIYRPGSQPCTRTFIDEFADVVSRAGLLGDPVVLVGDVNIRLDRDDDPWTCQFNDIISAHGMKCHVTSPTHDRGGLLDVVITPVDQSPMPLVDIVDVGLSDHRLLRWETRLTRPLPTYDTVNTRPWKQLNLDILRSSLLSSRLCDSSAWAGLSADDLAEIYDTELTAVLDVLVPHRSLRIRKRASDPWFDTECRESKREVRRLERASRQASKTNSTSATEAESAWRTACRAYRELLQSKREAFWRTQVDEQRGQPRRLWRSVDNIMGRGKPPDTDDIAADVFHRFFDDKIASVLQSTAGAPPPTFTRCPSECSMDCFRMPTCDEIISAVKHLPDKQCLSDPIPTRYVKACADTLTPFIAHMFGLCMRNGEFPARFKDAYITPIVKKAGMDLWDPKSYRPISNLYVLSKLMERLVAKQLLDYIDSSGLMPRLQSAYRRFHSTETAVLRVLADILSSLDRGDVIVLSLLDLSAAFDTVDHSILLRRLELSYGLSGSVLRWFHSYLTDRSQAVRRRGSDSTRQSVPQGVPQGSVLGPILFLLYTADLLTLIEGQGFRPHLYADDTQVYASCPPTSTAELQRRLSACLDDVILWMRSNRLQLNTSKTEILWCATGRRQHQVPTDDVRVGSDLVTPVSSVRNLGIYVDSDVSMRTHVIKTAAACFAVLRRLRSISRYVTRPVMQSLVVALVLSRLDYGSATLIGLPANLICRLESILHSAARLVVGARSYDHITPILQGLHWLRYPQRIQFRVAVLTFRCLHGMAPRYLSDDLERIAEIDSRRRLRSSSSNALMVPRTRLATVGDRAFPVAAACLWNSLPFAVTSSTSLAMFRCRLKTELFRICYNIH